MKTADRLARLDAIRAFGVLLVIAYHTSYRFAPIDGDPVGRTLRVIGWMGVDLFFALSGFLVGTILAKEKNRKDIALFFRKRFYRIVPIFVVAVVTFAMADIVINEARNLANMWKPLFFLTGYLQPIQGEAVVPYTITWSLSVEVTAYVLLGILAWKAWPRFGQMLIALVVLSIPLRIWLFVGLGWEEGMIGIFPPARIDAIALGAIAAIGKFDRLLEIPRAALTYGLLTIATIISFRYATWYPPFISTFGYLIFGLFAALWVAALARLEPTDNRSLGFFASVGLVSYFMYLFHLFVIEALLLINTRYAFGIGFWTAFIVASLLTYWAGLVSWKIFEFPLIKLGSRQKAARPSLVP